MATLADRAVVPASEKPNRLPESSYGGTWTPIFAGCFVFLVCMLRSFVLPHTPLLFWGDAVGYATKGERMLSGEMPYRDFFDFVPPATEMVYAALFRVFGVSLWVPDGLMCAIGGMVAWSCTWLAGRLVRGWLILLPGVLIGGFVLWGSLDATHHWFSTLSILLIVMVLFDEVTTWRVVLAGMLCGVTATFTQSKGAGAVAGLLAYLWWVSRQEQGDSGTLRRNPLLLCGSALAVFTVANLPFILASGVRLWIADVIVFPVRYFGAASANNWSAMMHEFPEHAGVLKYGVYPFLLVGVPLSYLLTIVRAGEQDGHTRRRLMLLAIVGVATLAVVMPSLSIRRLSCASPLAMILMTWLLSSSGPRRRLIAKGLAGMSLAIMVAQIAAIQFHRHYLLELPSGKVAVLDPGIAEVYSSLASRTHPGDWFFGLPPLSLPLGLRNPTPIESPSPGEYTRPEQIAAVIAGLERTRTPLLLLRPVMYTPYALGYKGDHLAPFRAYLMDHYERTQVFSTGDEVWVRLEL